MGRDKPKKYSKMGYFEKEEWKADQAKKRGIQGIEYRDSRGNTQTRVNEKALKASIRNDFDYRTSAQHMDDAKGNGKFNDFTNYERAAVKLHRKAGNGGQYSSNKDITGVTNNLVREAKKNEHANFATIDDMNGLKADMAARRDAYQGAAKAPLQKSNELAGAEQRLAGYDSSSSIYGFNNNAAPTDNAPKDAARNFLFDYKSKLKAQVA